MKSLINNKHYFLLLTFFVILSSTLFAENEFKRLGKSGFSFLKISPSARAAGMGDAFTAVANDVTAIFLILLD
jgi:hypothetical protein